MGEETPDQNQNDLLEPILADVHGYGDIFSAAQRKVGIVEGLQDPKGTWVLLGVGSKPHDSPALGVVDENGQISKVRRSSLGAMPEDLAVAGGEEAWSKNRVRDVGMYRKQSNQSGDRIVGVDTSGGVFVGPLTGEALTALQNAGFEESREQDFAGGALKSSEVLLPGQHADLTPEDGSYYQPTNPIDPNVHSGEWMQSVDYWQHRAEEQGQTAA